MQLVHGQLQRRESQTLLDCGRCYNMRHQPQIAVWEVWVEHPSFKSWVLETQDECPGRQRRWGLTFGQNHGWSTGDILTWEVLRVPISDSDAKSRNKILQSFFSDKVLRPSALFLKQHKDRSTCWVSSRCSFLCNFWEWSMPFLFI